MATVFAVVLTAGLYVDAAPLDVPQSMKKAVGLYEGDGGRFLLRESEGGLEMVYDLGDVKDPAFSLYATYPLRAVAGDVYRVNIASPLGKDTGIIRIERNADGFGTVCRIGPAVYNRQFYDPEKGVTYRIKPLRPTDELRRQAAATTPPREQGTFLLPDLVNVAAMDHTIRLDIRYATTNNFMGTALYDRPRAFLQRPAAEALARAHTKLAGHGYGIIIHDAYRPWAVTKMFWDATPDAQKIYVADPAKGSRHNRGGAVDVSLYDLATGQPVAMISGFDEFSKRSNPGYPGGTTLERWQRDLLRLYMEGEGFSVYEEEWWHFDYRDWRHYPIMNISFTELDEANLRSIN